MLLCEGLELSDGASECVDAEDMERFTPMSFLVSVNRSNNPWPGSNGRGTSWKKAGNLSLTLPTPSFFCGIYSSRGTLTSPTLVLVFCDTGLALLSGSMPIWRTPVVLAVDVDAGMDVDKGVDDDEVVATDAVPTVGFEASGIGDGVSDTPETPVELCGVAVDETLSPPALPLAAAATAAAFRCVLLFEWHWHGLPASQPQCFVTAATLFVFLPQVHAPVECEFLDFLISLQCLHCDEGRPFGLIIISG